MVRQVQIREITVKSSYVGLGGGGRGQGPAVHVAVPGAGGGEGEAEGEQGEPDELLVVALAGGREDEEPDGGAGALVAGCRVIESLI